MNEQTIRQSVLALLARLPRSEWGNFWLIAQVIYGEKLGANVLIDGKMRFDPRISELSNVLDAMKEEGLIDRSGHTGWRLAP